MFLKVGRHTFNWSFAATTHNKTFCSCHIRNDCTKRNEEEQTRNSNTAPNENTSEQAEYKYL